MWVQVLFLVFLLCSTSHSRANDGLLLHIGSVHFTNNNERNNINLGLGHTWKGGYVDALLAKTYRDSELSYDTAGFFVNSRKKVSLYIGHHFHLGCIARVQYGVTVGFATGYYRVRYNGYPIPVAIPTVAYPLGSKTNLRISLFPTDRGSVNLSIGHRFR